MTLSIAVRVALGSGIIFTKFYLRELIRRASIIAFSMIIRYVTLTFEQLTLKDLGTSSFMWSKSVRNLSEIEQSPADLFKILVIFGHVMSHCDLDLWPFELELLQHFECHICKLCTKFERNRITHGWAIDDLARFRRAILGVGHAWQTVLRVA